MVCLSFSLKFWDLFTSLPFPLKNSTVPFSYRFSLSKCIFYCGSRNLKKMKQTRMLLRNGVTKVTKENLMGKGKRHECHSQGRITARRCCYQTYTTYAGRMP